MKEYTPAITKRDTEELIAIANGTTDDWQQDAIEQAKVELRLRNVSIDYQKTVLDRLKDEKKRIELTNQKQLEDNETEGYSIDKMFYIFLVAPFILFGKWSVDLSLTDLRRENYKKKFRQRLFLLLGGTTFWILFLVVNINDYEKQRQDEIDNADISEWEKHYYGNDSLSTNKKTR